MAIGYSLRMCARHVDSTNTSRSNLVFRSKPIAEAEMSNRFIAYTKMTFKLNFIDQFRADVNYHSTPLNLLLNKANICHRRLSAAAAKMSCNMPKTNFC